MLPPPRTESVRTCLGPLAARAVGGQGARDPQHAVLEEKTGQYIKRSSNPSQGYRVRGGQGGEGVRGHAWP